MRIVGWRSLALGVELAFAPLSCARPAGDDVEFPRVEAASSGDGSSPGDGLERKPADRLGSDAVPPTVELELRQLSSKHIVVPMTIGEHEAMSFILDTGASISVISRETRDQLGLRDRDGTPVRGQGANGELSDVRVFTLPSARVGERAYDGLSVAVMDLAHLEDRLDVPIAGILGRNFLERHDVEVDFVGHRLRLHPAGSVQAGAVDVSPMAGTAYGSFVGGLIRIEVSIDGGERFPAVLDLGAARSVINWHAARSRGLGPRSKQLRRGSEALLGADNTPIETKFHTFQAISVGETSISTPTVHIADLEVFDTLGVSRGPAMVFGLDMLSGRTLVIDYQGKQVYISREAV